MKNNPDCSPWLEQQLRNLPETADKAMSGLTAGPALRAKILAAKGYTHQKKPIRWMRLVPAMACALVLAIGAVVGIPALTSAPEESPLIHTQPAGNEEGVGQTRSLLDLTNDNVTISNNGQTPAYRSIWAKGSNGNFPLVGVNGKYYRLLTSPTSISEQQLGSSLGTVSEFTTEPSLSAGSGILSNSAAFGEAVYEVKGMGGTLVAARVDGSMRVFQRVSFNGNALKGGEKLKDTLQISGHVLAMELSDVGVVTDRNTCEDLLATLLNNATYESSGSVSARQSLLIELDTGITLQLAVKNDNLSACGTWSCPEFFDAFLSAAE
ncbi:MAG: hypothetical protein E7333_00310 [Clostridiales bacterium]|nr:hypothetical protein [Clostridiales bacterium]